MKKIYLVLMIAISFIACHKSPELYIDEVTKAVNESENQANKLDSIVYVLLENKTPAQISNLSNAAAVIIAQKLEEVKKGTPPSDGEDFKQAAESYIRSLLLMVKSQAVYANYSDSLLHETALSMDRENIEAINNAEIESKRYTEYRQAFIKAQNLK